MPASHLSSTPALKRRARPAEDGFGLVELMVVVLIVLVLMAIAISSFRGTKRTNQYRAAQAAASSYAEAIEAYMTDNGQRPPAMGAPEWPIGSRAQKVGGPVDQLLKAPSGGPRRYMPRAAPEAVSDGLVDLIRPGESPAARAQAWITYSVSGSTYVLRVTARAIGSEPALECGVTNGTALPTGLKRCQ